MQYVSKPSKAVLEMISGREMFEGEKGDERPDTSRCVFTLAFKNEYGHHIDLKSEQGPSPDDVTTLVTITMIGPNSLMENTITLEEARRIKAMLNKTIP